MDDMVERFQCPACNVAVRFLPRDRVFKHPTSAICPHSGLCLLKADSVSEIERLRAEVAGNDAECEELRRALYQCADRAKKAESALAELLALLRECEPIISAHAESLHLTDGFRWQPGACDGLAERVRLLVEDGE